MRYFYGILFFGTKIFLKYAHFSTDINTRMDNLSSFLSYRLLIYNSTRSQIINLLINGTVRGGLYDLNIVISNVA